MSYDLMVFDPATAPRDQDEFMAWYEEQTQWSEGHSYNDPVVSTAALQAWFHDMRESFPPMNGPYKSESYDSSVTDFSIGRHVIYAAFAWSMAEAAYPLMRQLAAKHQVGFFDVSGSSGEIVFPT